MSEEFLSKSRNILESFCSSTYAEDTRWKYYFSTNETDISILDFTNGYSLLVFAYDFAVVTSPSGERVTATLLSDEDGTPAVEFEILEGKTL